MANAPAIEVATLTKPAGRARVVACDAYPPHAMIHAALADQCELFVATDWQQVWTLCTQQAPDLVILNVTGNLEAGLTHCRELGHQPTTRAIPIILLGPISAPEAELACWEAGAVEFVATPAHPLTLRNRVMTQLALRQLEPADRQGSRERETVRW